MPARAKTRTGHNAASLGPHYTDQTRELGLVSGEKVGRVCDVLGRNNTMVVYDRGHADRRDIPRAASAAQRAPCGVQVGRVRVTRGYRLNLSLSSLHNPSRRYSPHITSHRTRRRRRRRRAACGMRHLKTNRLAFSMLLHSSISNHMLDILTMCVTNRLAYLPI